jgi:hypothetical protein
MALLDTDTVHTRHTTGQIPCYHGRRQPTCCSTRQLGAADSSVTADPLGLGLSLTRWVRSARRECLDHTIIHGQRHLLTTLGEYVVH